MSLVRLIEFKKFRAIFSRNRAKIHVATHSRFALLSCRSTHHIPPLPSHVFSGISAQAYHKMASRTDAADSDSDPWSGEYSIGPGSSSRLVRYKSRGRGDFDPFAYHANKDDSKVKTNNGKVQEVPMKARGPETKMGVKQECTQEKACADKSPGQSPPMKKIRG